MSNDKPELPSQCTCSPAWDKRCPAHGLDSPIVKARGEALDKIGRLIDAYMDDYEYYGPSGEGSAYPLDAEDLEIIRDAIEGLHGDERFVAAWDAWRALCREPAAVHEICTSRQLPPPCEHHASGELEWPDLNGLCPVCRIGYLEAQEEMLEEWQQRAHRAEEHAAEVERPLDAQMARLNARVTALNDAEMLLRRMVSRHRNGRPPITEEDWPHIERIAMRNASPLRDAAPEPGGKP